MKRKRILMVSSLFALVLIFGFSFNDSVIQQKQLQAEDEEQHSELHTKDLRPQEQLEAVYDLGIDLPEPIPSIDLYALNGSKIQSPVVIMNPVVFVEFKDDTGTWLTDANLQRLEELYNQSPTSVKEYYKKISYGNVTIESSFFPLDDEGFVVPFKSSYKRGYIMPRSASNPIGYDPKASGIHNPASARYHETKVIEEIIGTASGRYSVVSQQIGYHAYYENLNMNLQYTATNVFDWDFPLADNTKSWEQISADSFTFVFRGAVSGSSESSILWPHQFAYPNTTGSGATHSLGVASLDINEIDISGQVKPIFLNNYVIVPADEVGIDDGKMNILSASQNSGVVAHEMFHLFEAPDLYRSNYQGQAVGVWDLMGEQMETPQYLLQYTNAMFGIWDTPDFKEITKDITLEDRTNVTVNLAKYESIESDQNTAIKIVPEDTSKSEYFVVEYRKKEETGFDSSIPSTGLIVYRIHEGIPSQNQEGGFCGVTCGNILTGLPGEPTADEVFLF